MEKMRQTEVESGDVMRFTHFSNHAKKRLTQRTTLSSRALARVLDHRLFVHIGNEPGLPREHLLFYSEQDESTFVAVRDKLTGSVVTVLPLDYHENLAWSVAPAQVERAKVLASNASVRPSEMVAKLDKTSSSTVIAAPSYFVISCTYMTDSDRMSVKSLCKVPSSSYQYDIHTFIHDEGTPALLDNAAKQRELDPTRVCALAVRLGKKGIPQFLVLNDRPWLH